MNTYDPMDRIVYRHVDQQLAVYSVPVATAPSTTPLPSGYANGSPRTYLGRAGRLASASFDPAPSPMATAGGRRP